MSDKEDKKKSKKQVDILAKKKKKPNKNNKWYVINVRTGQENSVAENLKQRVDATDSEDLISEVLVPVQKKIVVKNGEQKTKEERIFPGYILVQMSLNQEAWSLITSTEGIRGFVKTDKHPRPLPEREVESIKKYMEVEQPSYQASFSVGEAVKITEGTFADVIGSVSDIDQDKGKVKVLISFLGREAPLELDFDQVSKLN